MIGHTPLETIAQHTQDSRFSISGMRRPKVLYIHIYIIFIFIFIFVLFWVFVYVDVFGMRVAFGTGVSQPHGSLQLKTFLTGKLVGCSYPGTRIQPTRPSGLRHWDPSLRSCQPCFSGQPVNNSFFETDSFYRDNKNLVLGFCLITTQLGIACKGRVRSKAHGFRQSEVCSCWNYAVLLRAEHTWISRKPAYPLLPTGQ